MIFSKDLRRDPTDIEQRGVLRDEGVGKIRSRVGILLSIYFLEGWKQEKRVALLDSVQDYLGYFPDQVTHYQIADESDYRRRPPNNPPEDLIEHQLSCREADTLAYSFRRINRKETDDPELFQMFAFGFAALRRNRPLSGLKAHFPPSFVFADPERYVQLVRSWSERLGAVHGSSGLGVLSMPGSELMEHAYHYPWLVQYPALEYDAMGSYWSETDEGGYEFPRSSNWLTILGRDNIAALGGTEAIRAKLTPGMSLIPFAGGVMIRACELPALGDEATGGIPEGYRSAARIIKPIRFEGYKWSIIKLPRELNTGREARLAETMKWIRRFD